MSQLFFIAELPLKTDTCNAVGRKIIVEEIEGIGNSTSTLQLTPQGWTLADRQDYPANFTRLKQLLTALNELKITQSLEAGTTYDQRFGIDTRLTLKDAEGKLLRTLQIGKTLSNGQQDPMAALMGGGSTASGRYLRLPEDEGTVYITSEPLRDLSTAPTDWLSPDFIQVHAPVTVSLSQPGQPETLAWEAGRIDEDDTVKLEGEIPAGMEQNTTALSALSTVLARASFEDVVSPEAAQGLIDPTQVQRAILFNLHGFTYTIDIYPKAAPGTENSLITIKVDAEFDPTRPAIDASSPETIEAADKAWAITLKQRQDQLAREQALTGHYYEVTSYTLQNLLKARTDFLQTQQQQ